MPPDGLGQCSPRSLNPPDARLANPSIWQRPSHTTPPPQEISIPPIFRPTFRPLACLYPWRAHSRPPTIKEGCPMTQLAARSPRASVSPCSAMVTAASVAIRAIRGNSLPAILSVAHSAPTRATNKAKQSHVQNRQPLAASRLPALRALRFYRTNPTARNTTAWICNHLPAQRCQRSTLPRVPPRLRGSIPRPVAHNVPCSRNKSAQFTWLSQSCYQMLKKATRRTKRAAQTLRHYPPRPDNRSAEADPAGLPKCRFSQSRRFALRAVSSLPGVHPIGERSL